MPTFQKIKPLRLKGKAMKALRHAVFIRAKGRCEACGAPAPWDGPWWVVGQLSHYPKSKGAGGGDTMEETRWECPGHMRRHAMGSKAKHGK